MATTDSNRTTMAFGVEASLNTEPTVTYYLGPNAIPAYGPEPERIAHDPIGPFPGAEAGVSIRTNVPVGFEGDFTRDHFLAFIEGFLRCSLSTTPRIFYPTEVRGTDYVVSANGALAENTLIVARGFATSGNNGFKVVSAGSDATHIVTSGLTAETLTSGQGATVEVCGFQFAAGDAQIDADGNLIATAKNLTDFGLEAGQMIFIGGDSAATKFATAAHRGYARVSIAPTSGKITLDNKQSGKFGAGAADNGATKTVQIFYGRTARVRATTHGSYSEKTYQFEIGHATLSAGSTAYEYLTGCAPMTCRWSLPTAAKATMSAQFTGSATVDPTASRRTGFTPPLARVAKQMLHTGDHVRRGRIRSGATDLTGYITQADFSIGTGAQLNFAHGSQGNVLFTYGDVTIDVTAQAFFSTMELIPALVADTTLNADWVTRAGGSTASSTDTWGFAVDIPALQMTTAPRSVDPGKVTGVAINFRAVRDTTYSTLMIVSDWPYLPGPS